MTTRLPTSTCVDAIALASQVCPNATWRSGRAHSFERGGTKRLEKKMEKNENDQNLAKRPDTSTFKKRKVPLIYGKVPLIFGGKETLIFHKYDRKVGIFTKTVPVGTYFTFAISEQACPISGGDKILTNKVLERKHVIS